MNKQKKIAISGVVIALYVTVMYFTQSFAFYQYQIRIATAIYSLAYFFPFLVIPLGVANLISNVLMGGLGLPDIIGGFIIGFLAGYLIQLVARNNLSEWLVGLPILLLPPIIVPSYLSYLIGVPYKILFVSIFIGQILPAIIGVLIVRWFKDKNILCC